MRGMVIALAGIILVGLATSSGGGFISFLMAGIWAGGLENSRFEQRPAIVLAFDRRCWPGPGSEVRFEDLPRDNCNPGALARGLSYVETFERYFAARRGSDSSASAGPPALPTFPEAGPSQRSNMLGAMESAGLAQSG